MRGYLLLRDNPYMAKTDADGRFQIKHVPVGEHIFRFWHEKVGYLREIRIGDRTRKTKAGRISLKIRGGRNDLGETLLAQRLFTM